MIMHFGNSDALVKTRKSAVLLRICSFFSHRKYPLSVLSMPLKNLMESSLVPLFQKVKEGIHINFSQLQTYIYLSTKSYLNVLLFGL